jgi:hypothetical protein
MIATTSLIECDRGVTFAIRLPSPAGVVRTFSQRSSSWWPCNGPLRPIGCAAVSGDEVSVAAGAVSDDLVTSTPGVAARSRAVAGR